MSLSEFELIERFFKSRMTGDLHPAVSLGIGDDAAIMHGRPGNRCAFVPMSSSMVFISLPGLIRRKSGSVLCESI